MFSNVLKHARLEIQKYEITKSVMSTWVDRGIRLWESE